MSRGWKVAPALLGVLVLLLAVNTVVTDRETKPARADVGRILELPGGDLQVRVDGPRGGRPIVLLHGFSSSLHWWEGAASRLARDRRVIRIDLLGHGGSEKPRDGYSMERQAGLVDAALGRLGVRRALIVGHSMGGTVATALAARAPGRVSGVAIIGTPPTHDSATLPFTARLGFVPVLGQAARRLATDGMVRGALEKAFVPGFEVPDQFVRDFRRMTYTSYDDSSAALTEYTKQKPLDERLAAAGVPLLVLQGEDDELVDPQSAREYARVPGARIVMLPGTGHSPNVEQPARTARLILGFDRRVARGQ